jgi:hypothetical protein
MLNNRLVNLQYQDMFCRFVNERICRIKCMGKVLFAEKTMFTICSHFANY